LDPLFRTAVKAYGSRVIGVVLSGMLNDGSYGLALVKQAGGLAMVQDPSDTMFPGMPLSAMRTTDVDHTDPAREIGDLLPRAVPASRPEGECAVPSDHDKTDEPDVAESGVHSLPEQGMGGPPAGLSGKLSIFQCPECGAPMWQLEDGLPTVRFRCQVGHGFTLQTMAVDQWTKLEAGLWSLVRAFEEHAALWELMAETCADKTRKDAARQIEEANRLREQAEVVRGLVMADRPVLGTICPDSPLVRADLQITPDRSFDPDRCPARSSAG